MRPQELRIGNIVFWKGKNPVVLDESDFGQLHHDLNYFDVANPIPITKEWLLKFEFSKKGSYWFPKNCWHRYFFHGYVLNLEPEGCIVPHAQVYFVHQLQNLYFALTGKELVIKP